MNASVKTVYAQRLRSAIHQLIGLCASFFVADVVCAQPSQAPKLPIEISNTRVIYDEQAPSASFSVQNHGEIPYMVALEVNTFCGLDKQCPSTEDFMATPGFRVIRPGERFSFRIVRLADDLPRDKESLYLIHFQIIPSQIQLSAEQIKASRINVALDGNMKLFWRPADLAGAFLGYEISSHLTARCIGNSLELKNSSPFWGTFSDIKAVDKSLLNAGPLPMIAPNSKLSFNILSCPRELEVSFIAESGKTTTVRKVKVQTEEFGSSE